MYDITSIWVFIKKHDKRIQLGLIGALIFLMGWHVGRIMSPYYSSHEIVFQDRDCSECSSSGGSKEALVNLQKEGIAQGESSPSVAGAVSQGEGSFVASVNSDLFHHSLCPAAKRINEENQLWFVSFEEAERAGFEPGKCTLEKMGKQ